MTATFVVGQTYYGTLAVAHSSFPVVCTKRTDKSVWFEHATSVAYKPARAKIHQWTDGSETANFHRCLFQRSHCLLLSIVTKGRKRPASFYCSLVAFKAMTTIPTIHLNGTGKDTLMAEYYAAYKAIKESIDKLLDATLNGRDFYPQGSDAFYQAREERQDALSKLHQVKAYIEEMITGIAEQ